MKDIKVIIAAHKKYPMPKDSMFLPVHVGAAGKDSIGYKRDDEGDNISTKNPSYCELTGLYWAWKNLKCEYLGLAHYRRNFTLSNHLVFLHGRTPEKRLERVLTQKQADKLLDQYDVIVPKRRNYFIETLYSHYSNTHYREHLDVTRDIVIEKYPEYLPYYDKVMKSKKGYMFNMYIMKKSLSDEYCQWMFDILFELESRLGEREYSQFQGRFYGRVSEIMFNVWLARQEDKRHIKVKQTGLLATESTNWFKKGSAFLMAKFFHKKYSGSF